MKLRPAWYCALLLLGLTLIPAEAQTDAPIRLALMADGAAARAASDLLTAELSKRDGMVLLERSEIEKVYGEQQLSTANQDLLKLGRILGADGILLLRTIDRDNRTSLEARLIAVKPGIALADFISPWPVGDPGQWSKFVVENFGPFFPKLAVLPKDAVPLSILNLRSTLPTVAGRNLERELTTLLIDRLTHESTVFVLERRQLADALAEKQLAVDESGFWTGRYLLDGVIDRDGFDPGRATISARLTPQGGGASTALEINGSRTNLAALADALAEKVLAALHRDSTETSWNPTQEAGQYFDEAKWALRWGLAPQAQAASESAWALGNRSPELAAVRIQAYCAELPARHGQAPGMPPPDPIILPRAVRALELFCGDSRMIFTNASNPDRAWYDLGMTALRAANATLEAFYYYAERRAGCEEELAHLRSVERQTVSILETNDANPTLCDGSNFREVLDWQSLNRLKWQQTGLCAEKPEDALAVLRKMLDNGYRPSTLPALGGWAWRDRKRVPELLQRWLEDVAQSTNFAARLEGLYLSLLRAPNDGSRLREGLEQSLLTEMWDHRAWLLSNDVNARLVGWTEAVLRDQADLTAHPNVRYEIEPFASFRQQTEVAFLKNPSAGSMEVYQDLFTPPSLMTPYWSEAQAGELLRLMESFQPAWLDKKAAHWIVDRMRKEAGANYQAVLPRTMVTKPVLSQQPTEASLPAEFVKWDLPKPTEGIMGRPMLRMADVVEGKLWFWYFYNLTLPHLIESRTVFLGVDPRTGRTRSIPFPPSLGDPIGSFLATSDSLYVSVVGKIERYRLDREVWENLPVPTEYAGILGQFGGRLYLSTIDTLFEVAPDSGTVQILASSRRRPAENALDPEWAFSTTRYFSTGGRIGVIAGLDWFVFDPPTHAWEQRQKLTVSRARAQYNGIVPYPGMDGALILVGGYGTPGPQRLLGFRHDAKAVETLLINHDKTREEADPDLDSLGTAARWDWPDQFVLDWSYILGESNGLWILNPLHVRLGTNESTREMGTPIADTRTATLFHFEPEYRRPASVLIQFATSADTPGPLPTGPPGFLVLWRKLASGNPGPPFWLNTPDALVFVGSATGHWLIPKADLDSRWRGARMGQRESSANDGRSSSNPPPVPVGTNVSKP